MNQDTRDTVTWVLTTLIALTVLIGLAIRLILLPYLREHLVAPMAQVKRQVSENHHHNKEPTLPDRIDDVAQATSAVGRDVKALTRVFDEHLEFSDRWIDLIEREIDLIKSKLTHRQEEGPNHEEAG